MSFTNINDPAGVKALLEQLRSSQDWQETVNASAEIHSSPEQTAPDSSQRDNSAIPSTSGTMISAPSTRSTTSGSSVHPAAVGVSKPSVTELLAQLQASGYTPPPTTFSSQPRPNRSSAGPSDVTSPDHAPTGRDLKTSLDEKTLQPLRRNEVDPKSLSFQQSLPHLARLSDDPSFVAAVRRLKKEQEDLEERLFVERRQIEREHEERVHVARTKARMIGASVSQHEADTLNSRLESELRRFDVDRALRAWDNLVSKQQTIMEELGVPTMFSTTSAGDKERQRRVMQVLEGITGGPEVPI